MSSCDAVNLMLLFITYLVTMLLSLGCKLKTIYPDAHDNQLYIKKSYISSMCVCCHFMGHSASVSSQTHKVMVPTSRVLQFAVYNINQLFKLSSIIAFKEDL